MTNKLNRVLLIDDNPHDNFFHERAINKTEKVKEVVAVGSGIEAIKYLKDNEKVQQHQLDLIFLDINMPGMDGWEFLEEYEELDIEQKGKIVVVMLTTSINPDDHEKAMRTNSIKTFLSKPLTPEMFDSLLKEHFPERIKE